MRSLRTLGLLSLLVLAACGQKGPLYLPDDKPVVVPPASGTGATGQTATEEEQEAARARRAAASGG